MHQRSPVTIYPKRGGYHRSRWGLLLSSGLCSLGLTLSGFARAESVPPVVAMPTKATPSPLLPQSQRIAAMELQIWQRINQIRKQQGLQPLQPNLPLIQVARTHSRRMAQLGCYSHECASGGNHRQRVRSAGIPADQIAETLYKVSRPQNLVDLTVRQWMQSPKHQQILLLPEVSETGVAIWRQGDTYYITQLFVEPSQTPGREQQPDSNPFASRQIFEQQFKIMPPKGAAQLFEAWQNQQLRQQLELPSSREESSLPVQQISSTLGTLAQRTGERAAVVYGISLQDQLHLLLVLPGSQPIAQVTPSLFASVGLGPDLLARNPSPQVIHRVIRPVKRADLVATTQELQRQVSDIRNTYATTYLTSAQKLHRWLIAPLEQHLKAHRINTLLFSMDDGLRSVPFATLHDGHQFLIEKYRMALIPSFGLTAISPTNWQTRPLLAMGIAESTHGLPRLPAVPLEISTLTNQLWRGPSQGTLNQQSTLNNLKQYHRQQNYSIIHLATHAEFRPGQVNNSFIQFWNQKLTLGQLNSLSQELQWQSQPMVELLVFSACQTALGNTEAELGFAGSALKAGVRSTLASLWLVNDEGSLGLMTRFYDALQQAPTKAEALRRAQLAMLKGDLQIKAGQLQVSEALRVPLPPELGQGGGDRNFTHPYFWSGYTVVGNWY